MNMQKFALGTAQFGMVYGVSNQEGNQPCHKEIDSILSLAKSLGIQRLDTAPDYAEAEKNIGYSLHGDNFFQITTKIPKIICERSNISEYINQSINQSLKALQCKKIDTVVLHSAENLLSTHSDEVYDTLNTLKKNHLVKKIGISSYYPHQVFEIANRYPIDCVQLPLNIFDQRFLESGCIHFLREKGIKVCVRSVFLQGLLLMELKDLPGYFNPYKSILERYQNELSKAQLDRLAVALSFIKNFNNIDEIIVGVHSHAQLLSIAQVWGQINFDFNYSQFSSINEYLILPKHWAV